MIVYIRTMSQQDQIPVHQQKITAIGAVDILRLQYNGKKTLQAHRDEYYILCVVMKGSGTMKCDMGTVAVRPKSILLVKPYQIHSAGPDASLVDAYFISIAPFLVPAFCRDILENIAIPDQCIKLSAMEMKVVLKMTQLLYQSFHDGNLYKTQITMHLLNAFLVKAAALFSVSIPQHKGKQNQSFRLSQKFKELVTQHSFLHTASFFADKLHITTAHLNECIKSTTGLSVTKFLQQALVLEAKRLLYYTHDDVKKIAFDLGFQDHTYFSRLFKKITHETPLTFRKRFHE